MNNHATNIEQQVMASVGVIYTVRTLASFTALKIYALVLSVWAVGRLVWVSKVFANFVTVEKGGFGAISNFALYAVEHTHVGVQIALLVAAAACISLAVDVVRRVAQPTHAYSF